MIDSLNNDVEIDDRPCPFCGHSTTLWKECDALDCDDGWVDLSLEDPINYGEGEECEACHECHAQGHIHWCPHCGKDIWDMDESDPARCHNCRAFGILQEDEATYICSSCGDAWSSDTFEEEECFT